MKCPVCQQETHPFMGEQSECKQQDHLYHYNPEGGYVVESYLYGGYRIHTTPEHPVNHRPLTSIYHSSAYFPLYQEETYLSFEQIKQVIEQLNHDRKELN